MGITDGFRPRFSSVQSSPRGTINLKWPWSGVFVVFWFLSIILLVSVTTALGWGALTWCAMIWFVLGMIPALILTGIAWILWEFLLKDLRAPKGLYLAREIGKFEHGSDATWGFYKHLASHKIGLDLHSASPHILVLGGSQSGKSTTLKMILMRFLGVDIKLSEGDRPLIIGIAVLGLIAAILPVLASESFLMIFGGLFFGAYSVATHTSPEAILGQYRMLYLVYWFFVFLACIIAFVFLKLLKNFMGKVPVNKEEKGRSNIILDYHGEYPFLEKYGFKIIDAREYNPLAENFDGENFSHIVSDFVDSFLVAFEQVGEVQRAILQKKLEETHDVAAACAAIEAQAQSTRSIAEKDRLTGLYLRLQKIAQYKGGKAVSDLTKDSKNIVFDMSGIRDRDTADFYAENILSRCMNKITSTQAGTNIIIDEAHRLNTKMLTEKGHEPMTMRIARESGKFNARLIVASQNLTDFPPGFSANFGNIIIFRSPAGMEQNILEQMTGIRRGMLQSVMNSLHKGEALLIGPHNYYALIRVMAAKFPSPVLKTNVEEEKLAQQPTELQPQTSKPENSTATTPPQMARKDEIIEALKGTALTSAGIARTLGYSAPSILYHLNVLVKEGKVIKYEDLETSRGVEIFYEINNPNRNESAFHRILMSKAMNELKVIGTAKVIGGRDNPDLVFNGKMAVEVETGTKPELEGFRTQVEKRFGQGYEKVIVVVINQKQKMRYKLALDGLENVEVVKFTEIQKVCKGI